MSCLHCVNKTRVPGLGQAERAKEGRGLSTAGRRAGLHQNCQRPLKCHSTHKQTSCHSTPNTGSCWHVPCDVALGVEVHIKTWSTGNKCTPPESPWAWMPPGVHRLLLVLLELFGDPQVTALAACGPRRVANGGLQALSALSLQIQPGPQHDTLFSDRQWPGMITVWS
jgi:hypothetical protein